MPEHFTSVTLKNFRGFRNQRSIKLAPLTFLVGPNSSGKSSIPASLMLLAQSQFFPSYSGPFEPSWMGPLIDLGSFQDAVYDHDYRKKIEILATLNIVPDGYLLSSKGSKHEVEFGFSIGGTRDVPIGRLTSARVGDVTSGHRLHVTFSKTQKVFNFNFAGIETKAHRETPTWWDYRPQWDVAARFSRTLLERNPAELLGKKAALRRILSHLESTYLYSAFCHQLVRVASGRMGPQRWYVPNADESHTPPWLDDDLRVYGRVDPQMIDAAHEGVPSRRIRHLKRPPDFNLNAILKDLSIGDNIFAERQTAYHSFIFVRDNVTGISSNLADVGYGASQVIPVVAACLADNPAPLIVEQPEIHLHPKAQGALGELLAYTSTLRQVIVETHSPHIINRARILIAKGDLDSSDIVINYVSRDARGSRVKTIGIDEQGEFTEDWPAGFFEERYEDAMTLLALRDAD